jgi:hypothetical protein
MKTIKSLSVLTFSLCFLSCSKVEFATNWADTYISYQLGKYIDLNSSQSQYLKLSLKDNIKSIRKSIYPKFSLELQAIEKELLSHKTFNLNTVSSHKNQMMKILFLGLQNFEQTAQVLVGQLSTSQVDNFKFQFEKKNNDLEKESLVASSSVEKRTDKIKKQFVEWMGDLSNNQLQEIQAYCEKTFFMNHAQIASRKTIVFNFLTQFANETLRKKFIHTLLTDYDSLFNGNAKVDRFAEQVRFNELIVSILNKRSNEQDKHLIAAIKDRIEQLNQSSQI